LPGRIIHRDFFAVGIAKLMNGAVSFFIRVYTLRFLDPAGYGVLSLGLDCIVLFDAILGSALDLGTMVLLTGGKRCEDRRIQPAEKAAIRLKLVLGALLLVFFASAGEWLGYRFLHGPGGRAFFLVVTTSGTGVLLVRSAQLYFQARLRFRIFGSIDVLHSSLRILLVGAVLFWGAPSAVPILACYTLAPVVVLAVCMVFARRVADWSNVRPGWPDVRAVSRLAVPILATVSVTTVVSRLDVFLMALRSNPAQLGLYGAALTLATIPEVFGAYLAPVFLPRILPARQTGHFFGLFRRYLLVAGSIAGALFALSLMVGRPALSFLLPAKYTPSVALVLILVPGTLAAASYIPLTLNFLMLTTPRTFLVIDGLAAPALLISYFLLIPTHGAWAAAWITCLYRLVKAGIVQARGYALARGPAAAPETVAESVPLP
jgi:O-antigen/teichoic acid export membrane protein